MSSPDPKPELARLLDMQLSVLDKEVFGVVTEQELREYEYRQERVQQLYRQLLRRKAAQRRKSERLI
jgi:hypothetical protein